jgi:hypothetical protein
MVKGVKLVINVPNAEKTFRRAKANENSPNACYVFPDLVGISALKLTELGSLLNLEEDFVPRCANNLQNDRPSSLAL